MGRESLRQIGDKGQGSRYWRAEITPPSCPISHARQPPIQYAQFCYIYAGARGDRRINIESINIALDAYNYIFHPLRTFLRSRPRPRPSTRRARSHLLSVHESFLIFRGLFCSSTIYASTWLRFMVFLLVGLCHDHDQGSREPHCRSISKTCGEARDK